MQSSGEEWTDLRQQSLMLVALGRSSAIDSQHGWRSSFRWVESVVQPNKFRLEGFRMVTTFFQSVLS